MPIPRHLKHPIALWIIDGRNAMTPPMKPSDVARAIGVQEPTVRAWETVRAGDTRRLPSSDNVDALARLFGNPPPGREPVDSQGELVEAIDRQTDAINALVERIDRMLLDQRVSSIEVMRALGALGVGRDHGETPDEVERGTHARTAR